MSTYSEQDHLNPNDPTYYAPRWLRERSALRLSPSSETSSERPRRPVSSSPAFDGLLEETVPVALRRPIDPEAALRLGPPVMDRRPVRHVERVVVKGFDVGAVGKIFAGFTAVLRACAHMLVAITEIRSEACRLESLFRPKASVDGLCESCHKVPSKKSRPMGRRSKASAVRIVPSW